MGNPASMLVATDFDVQAAELARRRAQVAEMLKQTQSPMQGQMISGHYVAPSWAQHLEKLGSSFLGNKSMEQAAEEESKLANDYRTGLGDAVETYMKTREGTPEQLQQGQGPLANPDDLQITPAVKGDPRRAMVDAMTSQFKELRDVGRADFANMGKQGMSQKDWLSLAAHFDPASVREAAVTGDMTKLRRPVKDHTVNGQVVQTSETGVNPVGDFRDKFAPPETMQGVNGPMTVQKTQGTGEIKTLGGSGPSVVVNTGEQGEAVFSKEASKQLANNLQVSMEEARKAQQSLETFSNAKTQLANIKGGTGSETILAAKKVMQMLGVPNDPSITSMEQVKSALGQAVMDNAKTLGTGNGFTDSDRKFLQELTFGNMALDKNTLERAVNLGLSGAVNKLRSHDALVNKASKTGGADPAVMETYKVAIPEYSLDENNFDYDPVTSRFRVKTSAGQGQNPIGVTAPKSQSTRLTPAEQQEKETLLADLRKRFKGQ